MIDPRVLREDPDRVRASLAKRGLPEDIVDVALAADAARRQAIAEFEAKRGEQKRLGSPRSPRSSQPRPRPSGPGTP